MTWSLAQHCRSHSALRSSTPTLRNHPLFVYTIYLHSHLTPFTNNRLLQFQSFHRNETHWKIIYFLFCFDYNKANPLLLLFNQKQNIHDMTKAVKTFVFRLGPTLVVKENRIFRVHFARDLKFDMQSISVLNRHILHYTQYI